MASSITNASAIAAVDAVADLVDAGSADANGDLKMYSGTIPADADTALGGAVLLSTNEMAIPAFAGGIDANPGGRAIANAIVDATVGVTGTASFFRVTDRDNGAVYQGTVTGLAGGGDIELNSVALQSGATLSITSLSITMPET